MIIWMSIETTVFLSTPCPQKNGKFTELIKKSLPLIIKNIYIINILKSFNLNHHKKGDDDGKEEID